MAAFALPENTAGELLAMRLVLSCYLETPDGERPCYHHPRPLYQRAGLSQDEGAKLLALWSNRGWWSPTPSYVHGLPTESGIVAFAKIMDAVSPEAWRLWFEGITAGQLLELIPRPWSAGPEDLVAMCFACGHAWATTRHEVAQELGETRAHRCPRCNAKPKRRDPAPRPVTCDPAPATEDADA